ILDLKATYESFLAETNATEAEWERRRGGVPTVLPAATPPLRGFAPALRSIPEPAGLPLSRPLHRRFELPERSPDGEEWPPYAAWAVNAESIGRLTAALQEVRGDG